MSFRLYNCTTIIAKAVTHLFNIKNNCLMLKTRQFVRSYNTANVERNKKRNFIILPLFLLSLYPYSLTLLLKENGI